MIHSSLFSIGESTDWNVKQVREHLRISEDQFKILCSLPGWSKEKSNSNISRIDKDTTIGSSQSSQFQTCAASQNSKKKQNLELFEKHLQYRRNILKSSQINSKKFSRSSSLISIDKISENLSDDESLKRTLSVPVLYYTLGVSSTIVLSQESDSVIASLKRHFHAAGEKLPVDKSIKNTILEQQKSENLPKPRSEIMEVVSQLPVNISSHVVEKVDMHDATEKLSVNKSVENSTILSYDKSENPPQTRFEIKVMSQLSAVHLSPTKNPDDKSEFEIVEKIVSDTVHITGNFEKSNDVHPEPAIPANITLSVNNSNFALNEKKCMLDKPYDSELSENKLNSCVVKETCSQAINTENGKINLNAEKLPEISETPLENIKTLQPATNVSVPANNSSPFIEKAYQLDNGSESKENEFDSCIVKETCIVATDTGDGKMNLNNEKLLEVGETCSENAESLKPTPEKPSVSTDNLIFDIKKKRTDLQNVISKISSHEKPSKQKTDCETSVLEKRKLEFKSKISKKRKHTHEKQDHYDARSIKRAAEICYSEDSLKSMINLLKGFF